MRSKLSAEQTVRIKHAKLAAEKLMAFYPRITASDPEVFLNGLVTLLAEYPDHVLLKAIHPSQGIPAWRKFVPSIAEVKEFCDTLTAWDREAEERAARRPQPVTDAPRLQGPSRPERETYEQLKARHGENWGIKQPVKPDAWKPPEFSELCREHNVDPDSIRDTDPETWKKMSTGVAR